MQETVTITISRNTLAAVQDILNLAAEERANFDAGTDSTAQQDAATEAFFDACAKPETMLSNSELSILEDMLADRIEMLQDESEAKCDPRLSGGYDEIIETTEALLEKVQSMYC